MWENDFVQTTIRTLSKASVNLNKNTNKYHWKDTFSVDKKYISLFFIFIIREVRHNLTFRNCFPYLPLMRICYHLLLKINHTFIDWVFKSWNIPSSESSSKRSWFFVLLGGVCLGVGDSLFMKGLWSEGISKVDKIYTEYFQFGT